MKGLWKCKKGLWNVRKDYGMQQMTRNIQRDYEV
jgi:hypothetical protein